MGASEAMLLPPWAGDDSSGQRAKEREYWWPPTRDTEIGSSRSSLLGYGEGGGNGAANIAGNSRERRYFQRRNFVDAGCQRIRRSALIVGRTRGGGIGRGPSRRCIDFMICQGQEMPRGGSERPMKQKKGVGKKRL